MQCWCLYIVSNICWSHVKIHRIVLPILPLLSPPVKIPVGKDTKQVDTINPELFTTCLKMTMGDTELVINGKLTLLGGFIFIAKKFENKMCDISMSIYGFSFFVQVLSSNIL